MSDIAQVSDERGQSGGGDRDKNHPKHIHGHLVHAKKHLIRACPAPYIPCVEDLAGDGEGELGHTPDSNEVQRPSCQLKRTSSMSQAKTDSVVLEALPTTTSIYNNFSSTKSTSGSGERRSRPRNKSPPGIFIFSTYSSSSSSSSAGGVAFLLFFFDGVFSSPV